MSNSQIVNCEQLDDLWQTVKNNSSDFVGWTSLLQRCEHMQNIESMREAYNGFLSHYPYCYVYWKKFADFEYQMSGQENALDVLTRAVDAFPISIDIWIYFIEIYIKTKKSEIEIRNLFERALKLCGNDYNSSDLWSLYLDWLTTTRQDLSEETIIYDRLLETSTKHIRQHFKNFSSFVSNNNPICIISKNEYNCHWSEYFKFNDNIKQDTNDAKYEESVTKIKFIRKKIIEKRKIIFDLTLRETKERERFEEGIKRPYFHINPLDIQQLDNWIQYLNWEIDHNIHYKVILLFERCLVSCALYEHMWIRYSNYLIEKRYELIKNGEMFFEYFDINAIRDVFRRATQIHTKKSFKLNNLWSLFEEREGNFDEAMKILDTFEDKNPEQIEITISKINLYHRSGDLNAVQKLFKSSIDRFMDCPKLCSHLSIKYSRFVLKVLKNPKVAIDVLNTALRRHPNNYVIYLKLIDIEYQKQDMDVIRIENLFNDMIASNESISLKTAMTQRKLEFMQDFGFDCQKIQSTITQIQNLMHGLNEEFESLNSESVKRFKNDKN